MIKKLIMFVATVIITVVATTIIIINNIQITNITESNSNKGTVTITLFNNDYNYYFELQ